MQVQLSIDQIINSIAQKLYPSATFNSFARPILDRERGMLTSDICQQIAAFEKISPDAIAEKFLPLLKEKLSAKVSYVAGFLNFSWENPQQELFLLDKSLPFPKQHIYLAPASETLSAAQYMRFAAQAFLQAHLLNKLGYQVNFTIGNKDYANVSHGDLKEVFWEILSTPTSDNRECFTSAEIKNQAESFVKVQPNNSFVWLTYCSMNNIEFNQFFHGLQGTEVILKCIGRTVFLDLDNYGLDQLSKENIMAIWLLSTSTEPGRSFDWNIARAAENASLAWLLHSTAQRMEQVCEWLQETNKSTKTNASELTWSDLSEVEADLLILVWQLDRFTRFAGIYAESQEWYVALEHLLLSVNRQLNTPKSRLDILTGNLNANQTYIFSVVYQRLSSILKLLV